MILLDEKQTKALVLMLETDTVTKEFIEKRLRQLIEFAESEKHVRERIYRDVSNVNLPEVTDLSEIHKAVMEQIIKGYQESIKKCVSVKEALINKTDSYKALLNGLVG